MWFEGITTPSEFKNVLINALQTVPPGESTPMWTMVSSNVGTTESDDGYVFYSSGSTGTEELYIGFKVPMKADALSFDGGHLFFIAENYQPGNMGANGTFTNVISEYFRIWPPTGKYGDNPASLPLQYYFSITRDRVILVVKPVYHDEYAHFILYLGLIKRYFPESDKWASIIATSHARQHNYRDSMRVLRTLAGDTGQILRYYGLSFNRIDSSTLSAAYVNGPFATPIVVGENGFARGELDGILVSPYTTNLKVPKFGTAVINNKEYLILHKPYRQYSQHSNFISYSGSDNHTYFIEKR